MLYQSAHIHYVFSAACVLINYPDHSIRRNSMRLLQTFTKIILLISLSVWLTACGGGGGSSDDDIDILPLQLPFEYTIGARTLEVPTNGGTVHISVGPFGAHFQPLSGDPIGDAKSNLIGWFARDSTELLEVPSSGGNGNGNCDSGEICAFWGGLGGDQIRAHIPTYIAPVAGKLTHLRLNSGPDPTYFDTPVQWEIIMALSSRFSLRIGHIGGIAPTLRDKILAATGIDTDSYTGPTGNLFTGKEISIAAGEALAFPQVFARELQPGYYIGGGSMISPWAQMEYDVVDHQESDQVCVYDLLTPTQKAAIQDMMVADMANPDSQRYSAFSASRWVWSAEGLLCPSYSSQPNNFSSIHTRFGGWTERPEVGTTINEQFSIVKIEKTSAIYDVTNYDSAAVDHLALRAVGPGFPGFSWTMPNSDVVTPFIAIGEVIEEGPNSLLIKWRDIGWIAPVYQRAAFLLDSRGLKIKWGIFAAASIDAMLPTLGSGEACNDSDILCYDHQPRL
jgi:hypothetical protein